MVAYSLLCGNEPFYDDDSAVLMENNKQALYDFSSPRWDRVSCHARDFVERALADKAETRINAEESKRHPWLKEFFAVDNNYSNNYQNHQRYNSYPPPNSPHVCSITNISNRAAVHMIVDDITNQAQGSLSLDTNTSSESTSVATEHSSRPQQMASEGYEHPFQYDRVNNRVKHHPSSCNLA